jgi:hypothetical protein
MHARQNRRTNLPKEQSKSAAVLFGSRRRPATVRCAARNG